MKKRGFKTWILTLLGIIPACTFGGAPEYMGVVHDIDISGVVSNTATGEVLAGLRAELLGGGLTNATTTSSSGWYYLYFYDAPAGNYTLRIVGAAGNTNDTVFHVPGVPYSTNIDVLF